LSRTGSAANESQNQPAGCQRYIRKKQLQRRGRRLLAMFVAERADFSTGFPQGAAGRFLLKFIFARDSAESGGARSCVLANSCGAR